MDIIKESKMDKIIIDILEQKVKFLQKEITDSNCAVRSHQLSVDQFKEKIKQDTVYMEYIKELLLIKESRNDN